MQGDLTELWNIKEKIMEYIKSYNKVMITEVT